jgi:hypothetical protein
MNYEQFLEGKTQFGADSGFAPVFMPEFLFDFQRSLVEWSVRKGRAAIFADCGLGKTPMQLVWAQNVHQHTGKRVLVLTPLAVGQQTVREAHKFNLDASQSRDGKLDAPLVVTNYEKLHLFKPEDFGGVVCDESSVIKSFDAQRTGAVVDFMRVVPYRLLCTATAAPNDYIELGNSSEALGYLGFQDMLSKFFKRETGTGNAWGRNFYRLRGHASRDFWRWICSWARAIRKPSDICGCDSRFVLPPLVSREHVISTRTKRAGFLFDMPAVTLEEQREERKRTLPERCEKAAALVAKTGQPAVVWCHLNAESNLLRKSIAGCVEVSGDDADESKEEKFLAFERGEARVMVTKPSVAGFGLNWQHCAHQTFFPSHSFEQYYQAVRRSWRFGQSRPVHVDVITTEGESGVLANLKRKAEAADKMFAQLVELMNNELRIIALDRFQKDVKQPEWLAPRQVEAV